jgi:hypothetical protein
LEPLYGATLARALARPVSTFIADGSAVIVRLGRRLATVAAVAMDEADART